MGGEVIRENHCSECGRAFMLRYSKSTGQAQQMWQGGCPKGSRPGEPCFKKHMPPSDFRADHTVEQGKRTPGGQHPPQG